MNPRTQDFRLLTFHGKLNPTKDDCEAKLRNDLYLIGSLTLNFSRAKKVNIRLVGYEVPLLGGTSRGNCMDLLGYDKDHTPYIFELKVDSSNEKLDKIVTQINDYADKFISVHDAVEAELQRKLHIPTFKLGKDITKVILIPRDYYRHNPIDDFSKSDILFCSISGLRDTINVLSKRTSKDDVELVVHNK
jgi:hypothetical protein